VRRHILCLAPSSGLRHPKTRTVQHISIDHGRRLVLVRRISRNERQSRCPLRANEFPLRDTFGAGFHSARDGANATRFGYELVCSLTFDLQPAALSAVRLILVSLGLDRTPREKIRILRFLEARARHFGFQVKAL
jgi:hypothetical protein